MTDRAASLLAGLLGALLWATPWAASPAAAQGLGPSVGFGPLPSFAWPRPDGIDAERWAGSYARVSTGFEVASSRRFGGSAGPFVGIEAGRTWREGDLVYGIVGGLDYPTAPGFGGTPGFGGYAYGRDFAGAFQVRVGALVAPDVLVYAKAGAVAVHERLRVGPTAGSLPWSRAELAVRPDARVGVEWAVTDRLSVAVEAGAIGGGFR